MKRAMFVMLAVTLVAGSSGCCCLDRLFCWGCRGPCSYGGCYGHEGPGCDSCGYSGGGRCADCASVGRRGNSQGYNQGYSDEAAMAQQGPPPGMAQGMASTHPGNGHPLVRERRNAGGEYEFAAGPPSGGVTYPYYTNRGPRDFLARNPRSIGP